MRQLNYSIMKALYTLIILLIPFLGFGQKIFEVNNHPKSKGLNFSITEPISFERVDGKRPNILFNWLKNRDDLINRVTISIMINDLPKEIQMSKKEWIQYLKYDTGILDFTSNFENVQKQKYIVVESYPGVLFNRTDERQRIDFERKTFNRTCILFVEDKMFSINMTASSLSNLELNEKTFLSMINSIVFPEQYN